MTSIYETILEDMLILASFMRVNVKGESEPARSISELSSCLGPLGHQGPL